MSDLDDELLEIVSGAMLWQQAETVAHASVLGIDPDTLAGKERRRDLPTALAQIHQAFQDAGYTKRRTVAEFDQEGEGDV